MLLHGTTSGDVVLANKLIRFFRLGANYAFFLNLELAKMMIRLGISNIYINNRMIRVEFISSSIYSVKNYLILKFDDS